MTIGNKTIFALVSLMISGMIMFLVGGVMFNLTLIQEKTYTVQSGVWTLIMVIGTSFLVFVVGYIFGSAKEEIK